MLSNSGYIYSAIITAEEWRSVHILDEKVWGCFPLEDNIPDGFGIDNIGGFINIYDSILLTTPHCLFKRIDSEAKEISRKQMNMNSKIFSEM